MPIWTLLLLACSPEEVASVDTGRIDDVWGDHALLQEGFFSVAHRGGRALWPEHTMLAYNNAISVGADVLECDAHASSDGIVMCMHDVDLARTTDGEGDLKDRTFDELRALDAGYWFSDDGTDYPHRGTGLQIPTLEELLTEHPGVPVSIEFKQTDPSIVPQVANLLDAHNAWGHTTLMSFFDPPIIELRERQPTALTALTILEGLAFMDADEDYVAPGQHLHAPMDFAGTPLDQAMLDRAHAAGIRVWVWTINNTDDMTALMEMGVDGIYTDDPVLLESLL